jgi:RNA polymerase sigma factor (sigma-70 family)
MSVIQHLWRGRRVRVAGALDQVAVDCPDDMAAIYQQYWELVYRRCLATLGDEQAAEDATQDVFLLALDNFEQVQHDIVRGLLDIARSISYERRRRPAREVSLADPPRHLNGGDDPAEIAERHGVLDAVWSGLSPVERRYVADKFAGFSFEEIARRNRRKLGTVSSNLFRAREHARSLRGPTLPAVLGVAGWRRLTDLARRARNTAHSTSTAAAAQPVQTLTISLTLAGLLVGVTPAVSSGVVAGAGSTAQPSAAVPPTQSDLSAGAPASRVNGIAASAPGSPVAYAPAPGSEKRGGAAGLPLPSAASSETPEDTVIYTATPSPNYDSDHTIVGLGHGDSCACNVLMRSTDGGATWTFREGAPGGDELVLPPDYPRDGSIFIGHASSPAPGSSNWWAKDFGAAFSPLAGPPGSIALSAAFDSGDPRILISTTSGVWSYNVGTLVLQPLVVEPRKGVTPALATPLGSLSTGVFAMTSSQAVTPDTIGNAVTPSNGMTLWACPPGRSCTDVASVPVLPGSSLALSPGYLADSTLIAYALDKAMLSQDGGGSFSPLSLPPGTSSFAAVALAPGADAPSLWVLAQRGTAAALEFAPRPGGSWHEVDDGLAQITSHGGRIVPLDAHRVVFLSMGGGFVCTVDDGGTWSPRCPAA